MVHEVHVVLNRNCTDKHTTHHLVVPQPFCGLDGPVQTGFPHIHVLSVGVPRQELHQSPNVYVVIVVHMTEPPERQK